MSRRSHRPELWWIAALLSAGTVGALGLRRDDKDGPGAYSVFGANDLGMHCMNSDYSEIMILPPFNSIRAQVIRRGTEPEIMTADVSVEYSLPSNTHSSDKSNFWKYPQALLGGAIPPDIGVAGKGMAGTMAAFPTRGDWEATGVPVIPIDDDGRENAYPLALIKVRRNGAVVAQTRAVVPVSTEMSCNLCHVSTEPGISVAGDILKDHDRLHATNLYAARPVACASCHADNALGAPGQPGISNLSAAVHAAHATRINVLTIDNKCYACHPGVRTNCQRDVHSAHNVTCISCHGDMAAVGNPARRPWLDEPRCDSCHSRPGFEFEQPGKLFKESIGHKGVLCITCHSSPHAITPAVTGIDNVQSLLHQNHTGPINDCSACHTNAPNPSSFFHSVDD
jgi:hypothetical protein